MDDPSTDLLMLSDPRFNVFHSFQRTSDGEIENNYTRALLVALLHVVKAGQLGRWLREIAPGSGPLHRVCDQAAVAFDAAGGAVTGGLVAWPPALDTPVRLLIGVRGSSPEVPNWASGTRLSEGGVLPDAWVASPGAVVVIEAKTERGHLDGQQIVRQAHHMGLTDPLQDRGLPLPLSADMAFTDADALAWQATLADRVVDVGWNRVIAALRIVASDVSDPVCRYILEQAVEWFEDEGLGSFAGFDQLQRRVGLARAASSRRGADGAILLKNRVAFDRLKRATMRDLKAMAAQIRPLLPDGFDRDPPPEGEVVEFSSLDEGDVSVRFRRGKGRGAISLWADLTGAQGAPMIGIAAYEEAEGITWPASADPNFAATWQKAADKLPMRQRELQKRWAAGISRVANLQGVEVAVYNLRFKGRKPNWQGGGEFVTEAFVEPAAAFRDHPLAPGHPLDASWKYPRPRTPEDREICRTEVRKPAISVRVPRTLPPGVSTEDGLRALVGDIERLAPFLT